MRPYDRCKQVEEGAHMVRSLVAAGHPIAAGRVYREMRQHVERLGDEIERLRTVGPVSDEPDVRV